MMYAQPSTTSDLFVRSVDILSSSSVSSSITSVVKGLEATAGSLQATGDLVTSTIFDPVSFHILEKLKGNSKLEERMKDEEKEEKQELGDLLTGPYGVVTEGLSLMQFLIDETRKLSTEEKPRSIFIESGSTLAYLGLSILKSDIPGKVGMSTATDSISFTTRICILWQSCDNSEKN